MGLAGEGNSTQASRSNNKSVGKIVKVRARRERVSTYFQYGTKPTETVVTNSRLIDEESHLLIKCVVVSLGSQMAFRLIAQNVTKISRKGLHQILPSMAESNKLQPCVNSSTGKEDTLWNSVSPEKFEILNLELV